MKAILPPKFGALLAALAGEPQHVREMWRYAMVMVMDDEKARVTEVRMNEGPVHLLMETVAGDRFSILRPDMFVELEKELMDQIREIVDGNTEVS